MLRAAVVASRLRGGVRFVYDDELGGVVQEALSIPIRLDEIDADDHVAIVLVEGDIATREPALQSPNPRRLDDCRLDIELRSQLLFPLFAQVRSTENADAAHAPRSNSSRAIMAASMVLPTPTSSAMSKRTGSSRSAMMSGTN